MTPRIVSYTLRAGAKVCLGKHHHFTPKRFGFAVHISNVAAALVQLAGYPPLFRRIALTAKK